MFGVSGQLRRVHRCRIVTKKNHSERIELASQRLRSVEIFGLMENETDDTDSLRCLTKF